MIIGACNHSFLFFIHFYLAYFHDLSLLFHTLIKHWPFLFSPFPECSSFFFLSSLFHFPIQSVMISKPLMWDIFLSGDLQFLIPNIWIFKLMETCYRRYFSDWGYPDDPIPFPDFFDGFHKIRAKLLKSDGVGALTFMKEWEFSVSSTKTIVSLPDTDPLSLIVSHQWLIVLSTSLTLNLHS